MKPSLKFDKQAIVARETSIARSPSANEPRPLSQFVMEEANICDRANVLAERVNEQDASLRHVGERIKAEATRGLIASERVLVAVLR